YSSIYSNRPSSVLADISKWTCILDCTFILCKSRGTNKPKRNYAYVFEFGKFHVPDFHKNCMVFYLKSDFFLLFNLSFVAVHLNISGHLIALALYFAHPVSS